MNTPRLSGTQFLLAQSYARQVPPDELGAFFDAMFGELIGLPPSRVTDEAVAEACERARRQFRALQ
jgi:hypothetical protein